VTEGRRPHFFDLVRSAYPDGCPNMVVAAFMSLDVSLSDFFRVLPDPAAKTLLLRELNEFRMLGIDAGVFFFFEDADLLLLLLLLYKFRMLGIDAGVFFFFADPLLLLLLELYKLMMLVCFFLLGCTFFVVVVFGLVTTKGL